MDMFAVDDEVAQWEAALLPLRGPARLPVLVPLAWHLRQRDTGRAVELASEGLQLLPATALAPDEMQLIAARLQLVHGEARWLAGELDAAAGIVEQAYQQLCALGDHQGCADAHWLRAWIAIDHGEHRRGEDELELMASAAGQVGDEQRIAVADAANARWAVLHDLPAAERRWGQRFAADPQSHHPAVSAWIYDYHGLAASQHSDYGGAARHYIHCYETALETGQLRVAITAAINIGLNFTILNDHHSALEWMQSALDLARPTGWPRSIGACLMHTADTMRRLGRLDATEELLEEALQILTPLSGARSYANALSYLGDLALDKNDYGAALDAFRRMEQRADALQQADFQSIARRGQAHALCYLERPQEALQMAHHAVELAAGQSNLVNHVAALRVLSEIHRRHPLPPPAGMTEQNATLHYLHQALEVASGINGYTLPGDLHDALGREYAQAGDYAKAYQSAQAAAAAREKIHSQEATNRAIAMQVHHQTEHARAEGMHHRELAASEAHRAEILQQTSATLERLSAIGQEITIQHPGRLRRRRARQRRRLPPAEGYPGPAGGPREAGLARFAGGRRRPRAEYADRQQPADGQHLQEKTDLLAARFAESNLKKSELEGWIAAASEASALIQRSLQAAAELVNSFKQVSVDQASTQRRRFDLAQACQEIAATIMNQVRRGGHALELRSNRAS
jgi:tetratricopeptide (TPR) repeat protein